MFITAEQIVLVMAEVERRWRARTPATTIADARPDDRVNRSEMNAFMIAHGIQIPMLDDDYDRAMFQLFDRLRAEFPDERWEPPSHWTARTKERRRELGIPTPRRRARLKAVTPSIFDVH